MSENIKVGVKIRPLIAKERAVSKEVHWTPTSDTVISQVDPATGALKGEPYVYDHVFSPDSTNQEVFEVLVRPIVESAVHGFNGTIFAYGQTSSGKTYTMMGDQYEPGIIPSAVNYVFRAIEETQGREFLLRVAYMEIYNERVNDLLCKKNLNLKVSEDTGGNIVVKDLVETITNSSQMVMDLMKKGEQIRKIGVTNMNERSSRSHSIFRIIIESRQTGGGDDEAIQVSHLNLVDLAGSERAGATGAVGDRLKEGCAINKSLFMLGHVISKLSEGDPYINFRDSKLTRILQSSLGGNALTAIICAVTPASIEETSSTLGFASRARNIKNKAQVNEVLSEAALLKRYAKQIKKLQSELDKIREGQPNDMSEKLQLQLEEKDKQNSLLQERITRLKETLVVSSATAESLDQSQKLKKLRRRTWCAPNKNLSRMSLAPVRSTPSVPDFREESSRCSISSVASDKLDDSDVFWTPLEEFEKALIKAERGKSLEPDDSWVPPAAFDDTEDDFGVSPLDDNIEMPPPTTNFVQTRRPKKTALSKVQQASSVLNTPPSKLREKAECNERELAEIAEFTRLEKQMFNEELETEIKNLTSELAERKSQCAELEKVREELCEARAEIASMQIVREELEALRSADRSAYDLQMLLMDANKKTSKLTDENRRLSEELKGARLHSQDFDRIKTSFDLAEKQLAVIRTEKSMMEERLLASESRLKELENEKEDFDMRLEMTVSKYVARENGLKTSLEDAWQELADVKSLLASKPNEKGTQRTPKPPIISREDRVIPSLRLPVEDPVTETVGALQERINALVSENAELQLALQSKAEELAHYIKLEDKVADLQHQLSVSRRPVQRRHFFSALNSSTLCSLEEEPCLDDLAEQVKMLKEENSELQHKLTHHLETNKTSDEEINSLSAKILSAQQEIEDMHISIDKKNKMVESLETALQQLGGQMEDKERELEELQEQKRLMSDRIDCLSTELAVLQDVQNQGDQMQESFNSLESTMKDLKSENSALLKEKQDLIEAIHIAGTRETELQKEIEVLKGTVESFRQDLLSLRETFEVKDALLKEMASLSEENENLSSVLEGLKRELKQLGIVNEEVENLRIEQGLLENENADLSACIQSVSSELESLRKPSEYDQVKQNCLSLKEKSEDLRAQLKSLQAEKSELESLVNSVEKEIEIAANIQEETGELMSEISSLEEENIKLTTRLEQLKVELNHSIGKNESLETMVVSLRADRKSVYEEISATESKLQDVTSNGIELAAEIKQLEENNSNSIATLNQLKEQIAKIKESDKERTALKEEQIGLQTQIQQHQEEMERLSDSKVMEVNVNDSCNVSLQDNTVTDVAQDVSIAPEAPKSLAEEMGMFIGQSLQSSRLDVSSSTCASLLLESTYNEHDISVQSEQFVATNPMSRILSEKLEDLQKENCALKASLDAATVEIEQLKSGLLAKGNAELSQIGMNVTELGDGIVLSECPGSVNEGVRTIESEASEATGDKLEVLETTKSEIDMKDTAVHAIEKVRKSLETNIEENKTEQDTSGCPSVRSSMSETSMDGLDSDKLSEPLKSAFEAMSAENIHRCQELEALKLKLERLNCSKQVSQDVDFLVAELVEAKSTITELTQAVEALKEDNSNLLCVLEGKREELSKVQGSGDNVDLNEYNSLLSEKKSLKSSLEAALKELASLKHTETRLEDVMKSLEVLQEEKNDLLGKLAHSRGELSVLDNREMCVLREENIKLSSLLEAKNKELVEFKLTAEQTAEDLLRDVQDLQKRNLDLAAILQQPEQETNINSIERSLPHSQSPSIESGNSSMCDETELIGLRTEINTLKEEKAALAMLLSNHENELQKLRDDNDKLLEELECVKKENTKLLEKNLEEIVLLKEQDGRKMLMSELALKQELIVKLGGERDTLLEERKVKETELESLSVELQTLKADLIEDSRQIQDNKGVADGSPDSNPRLLCEEVLQLQEELRQTKAEIFHLRETNNGLQSELKAKMQSVSDAASLSDSHVEIDSLKTKCTELQRRVQEAENILVNEIGAINQGEVDGSLQLDELIPEFIASVMKAQEKIAFIMQTNLSDLQTQLEVGQQRLKHTQERLEESENEIEHLRGEKNALYKPSVNTEKLEDELVSLRQSFDNFLKTLSLLVETPDFSLDTIIKEIQTRFEEFAEEKQVNNDLRSNLQNMELQCIASTSEVHELKELLRNHEESIEHLQSTLAEAKKSREELEDQLERFTAEHHSFKERIQMLTNEQETQEKIHAQLVNKDEIIFKLRSDLQTVSTELEAKNLREKHLQLTVHEVDQLESRLASLKITVTELNDEVSDLKKRNADLNTLLNEQQIHNKDLEEKLSKQEDLVCQFAEQEKKLFTIQDEMAVKENLVSQLNGKISDLEERSTELDRLFSEQQIRNKDLEEELSKLEDVVHQLAEQEKKIFTIQEEMAVKENLVTQLYGEISDLKERRTELDRLLCEQHIRNKDLEEELSKREDVVHQLAEQEKKIFTIQEEMAVKENLVTQLNGKISDLEERRTELDRLLSEQHIRNKDLEEELSKREDVVHQFAEQEQKMLTIQEEMAAKESLIEDLKQEIIASSSKLEGIPTVKELKTTVNKLQTQLASKESQFKLMQSKATSLYNDVTERNALVKKLENEVAEHQATISALQSEVEACKSAHEVASNETKKLQVELLQERSEKQVAIKNLEERNVLPPESVHKELQREINAHKDTMKGNRKLREAFKKLQIEVVELKQKLQKGTQSDLNLEMSKELHAKLAEITDKNERLEKQVSDLTSELTQLYKSKTSRVSNWKHKLEAGEASHLKSENERLKEDVEDERKLAQSFKNECKSLQVQLADKQQELGSLETEIAVRDEKIARFEQALQEKEDELRKLEGEAQKLQQNTTNWQNENPQSANMATLADFEKQVSDLKKLITVKDNILAENTNAIEKLKDQLQAQGNQSELQARLQKQDDRILELTAEVESLNKECDDCIAWGRGEQKEKAEVFDKLEAEMVAHSKLRVTVLDMEAAKILLMIRASRQIIGFTENESSEQLQMQLSSKEKAAKNAQSRAVHMISRISSLKSVILGIPELLPEINAEVEAMSTLMKDSEELLNTSLARFKGAASKVGELKEKTDALQAELDVERGKVSQLSKQSPLSANLLVSASSQTAQKLKQLTVANEELRAALKRENATECRCETLSKQVRELRISEAGFKASITQLQMQLQTKNMPAQKAIEDLKQQLKLLKETNLELKADNRRLMKTSQETTFRECAVCQIRFRNQRHAETQTTISGNQNSNNVVKSQYWLSGAPSGIVEEATASELRDKCRKLEQEKLAYKNLCQTRNAQIDNLKKENHHFRRKLEEQENLQPNGQDFGTPTASYERPVTRSSRKM